MPHVGVLQDRFHLVRSMSLAFVLFISPICAFSASSDVSVAGTVTAATFNGSGSGLTDLPSSSLYRTTILVSPTGTSKENGTALLAAFSAFPATPSASNPYLIKIEPGIYDVSASSIDMPEYVDMEGSGENVTKITGNRCDGTFTSPLGVVNGNNNTEVRFISVENTSTSGSMCMAIANNGVNKARILHVTATATGSGSRQAGIYNYQSDLSITQVNATATGAASINYGIRNYSSSPTITNTNAIASNGNKNRGIYNWDSFPSVTGSSLVASGGIESIGLFNSEDSMPTLSNSTITGESATDAYGIYNLGTTSGQMTVISSTMAGYSANDGYGIYNTGATGGQMIVEHSYIYGSYRFIASSSLDLRVNHSRLEGPSMSATDVTCLLSIGC